MLLLFYSKYLFNLEVISENLKIKNVSYFTIKKKERNCFINCYERCNNCVIFLVLNYSSNKYLCSSIFLKHLLIVTSDILQTSDKDFLVISKSFFLIWK